MTHTDPYPPDERQGADIDEELERVDPGLAGSLAQLLEVPADLEARTRRSVTSSMLDQSLLGTGADLLAVGWQTMALLVPRPDPLPSHNPSDPTSTGIPATPSPAPPDTPPRP